jgi:hypothetical protein
VINSKKDELFPTYLDMGKHLKVGETYTEIIKLESNCPVNFSYDIEVMKAHPDIEVTPLHDDILGMQDTMIAVHYTPSTFTTAECEIKFRTTEFDSQPIQCRIVGNALPTKQNVNGPRDIQSEDAPAELQYDVKKTKTRTLLTNKKDAMRTSSRAGVRLEKIQDT